VLTYIDIAQVWLREPLPKTELPRQFLRPYKAAVHYGKLKSDPSYRLRLRLHHGPELYSYLRYLDARGGVFLNYAELALDWVFDDETQHQYANEFAGQHQLKLYHRRQHGVNWVKGTRYSGPSGLAQRVVQYADRVSKVTGEGPCVHFCYRMRGVNALRRNGMDSLTDLLALNPREFWFKRLRFFAVDARALGRRLLNQQHRTRRRGPLISRRVLPNGREFQYDLDHRTGCVVLRAIPTVQEAVDFYKAKISIRACLVPIEISHLLPGMAYD
jgi:hypothetical protein